MKSLKNSSEKKIKEACLRWIKKEFSEIWIYKISDLFKSGVPDFMLVYKGKCLFIELKTKIGKVSRIQEYTFDEIRDTGTPVLICRSLDEFKLEVMEWKKSLK